MRFVAISHTSLYRGDNVSYRCAPMGVSIMVWAFASMELDCVSGQLSVSVFPLTVVVCVCAYLCPWISVVSVYLSQGEHIGMDCVPWTPVCLCVCTYV